jgi:HNH endonuclease
MSDRRYSTSAWQRVRKAVLARDGHVCRIQGPRCTYQATTVHHVIPSSARPDLFYSDTNLVSACARCNYGGGARIASGNRRRKLAELEQIIHEQEQRIAHLLERLAAYENSPVTPLAHNRPQPRIY